MSERRHRILILDDSESDADLVEYALRRDGGAYTFARAEDRDQFVAALASFKPDVVLSDYNLPQFSAIDALEIVRESGCDAAVILVTGTQSEEVAVQCMQLGAADYILKHNLTRLPTAVENALDRREARLEKERAVEALRQSEAQLRHAQKMEAIGRLAGGIAHDFNNHLTAIAGYSDLVLRRLHDADPLRELVHEIKRAGDRAATLTRHLLIFSRNQVVEPKIIDPNELIGSLGKMLQRLIGEDVVLSLDLGPEVSFVKADPSQLEQVVMNLAVNGRDAMPDGGRLVVRTRSVTLWKGAHPTLEAGEYVAISVSDTGCGIDDEIKGRIFEPFFTTKEAGKGTGIGLSTVYGIVTKAGGDIRVTDTPGGGATFDILLPVAVEAIEPVARPAVEAPIVRGGETVLVVEDESGVRRLTCEILKMGGYRVLDAANGGAALEICERAALEIDLVLTDVVMPGMGGRELAQQVVARWPEMKVLFMTGYTEDSIVRRNVAQGEIPLVQKPFTPAALLDKVRTTLDTNSRG
jgi:two-component system cell cycle sensor histidine kinase/response regulator CckA